MLELLQQIVKFITNDSVLMNINPSKPTQMYTGPVDILQQQQSGLLGPAIVLSQISEASRTVPLNTRDTQIQLDVISRNSQFEMEQMYELILNDLNYMFGSMSGRAYLFWERLSGAVDIFESDRRIWRRSVTFTCWTTKP